MRQLLLLLALFTGLVSVSSAQVCTPDSTHFTSGVYVYPATLPCITPGVPYSGVVSILVPDSVDASLVIPSLPPGFIFAHVDSVRIDSITGAPAGILIDNNPHDSSWLHGGQYGCIQFSGTTAVNSGNFPINVYVRACAHGSYNGIVIDTCVEHNIASFFNFSLNICSQACIVDTTHFSASNHVYPATLPCIVTGVPFTGQINIQVPDSLDASDFNPLFPANTFKIHVDSIQINTISGYPAGISSVSNPVLTTWLQPSAFACAAISGTVNGLTTPSGNYKLTITGKACGTFTVPGLNYSIDSCVNSTFTMAYPYSLTVCYPAGIASVLDNVSLNIYPNPNQGNFTVTVSSATRIAGTMSVLDQLGRTINTKSIDVTGSQQIALNLGDVSAGVYLLMINTAEGRSVKQFIVR